MQVWHQKTVFNTDLPLSIFTTDDNEFPPHWHEAIEIVYSLEDNLNVGVNNEIYTLNSKDILLISGGDVHYFVQQPTKVKRIILFIETSYFEIFTSTMKNKRFTRLMTPYSDITKASKGHNLHSALETNILEIYSEYCTLSPGYKLALTARLSDILVLIMRYAPVEVYSTYKKSRQLSRLERLNQVFDFVDKNFDRNISLQEIAAIANYSPYHFTRFFKETTGMTFNQYISNYRVAKASEALVLTDELITDVAYRAGFESIKTFNRVFKQIKGVSPSAFRKAISED